MGTDPWRKGRRGRNRRTTTLGPVATKRRRPRPSGRAAAAAAASVALVGAGLWWRRYTTPFPYSLRWMLGKELPYLTRDRLLELLAPGPGERMLEIGPGTGLYTVPVARAVRPGGTVDVLDVQQEMLDHTVRAAAQEQLDNVRPTRGDARTLPYPDASFDGAFLVTALGEIPDRTAALTELRRVLKPKGRVVVGEWSLDWHAVPVGLLRRHAGRAGLRIERTLGPRLSYYARLRADEEAPAAAP
jgi:SAM-dependent methyltransferase